VEAGRVAVACPFCLCSASSRCLFPAARRPGGSTASSPSARAADDHDHTADDHDHTAAD
jgi:hypothetical protein